MNALPINSASDELIRPAILIGIDWADSEHAYCAQLPDGSVRTGSFKQKQQAIESWVAELSKAAPDATLDICIETSTGPLINALSEYPPGPHLSAQSARAGQLPKSICTRWRKK